jgi:hypothetical protein
MTANAFAFINYRVNQYDNFQSMGASFFQYLIANSLSFINIINGITAE